MSDEDNTEAPAFAPRANGWINQILERVGRSSLLRQRLAPESPVSTAALLRLDELVREYLDSDKAYRLAVLRRKKRRGYKLGDISEARDRYDAARAALVAAVAP